MRITGTKFAIFPVILELYKNSYSLFICHRDMFPAIELIQNVEFIDLVGDVADEEVDVVLCNIQA